MQLSKRQLFWSKSLSTRDYVQDGLLAMWDGIENAGIGIHRADATTWVDLTNNGYDYALYGGYSWNRDSLHFNGIDARGQTADIPSSNVFFTGPITVECVFSQDKGVTAWGNIFCSVGRNPGYGAAIQTRTRNLDQIQLNTQIGSSPLANTNITDVAAYLMDGHVGQLTFTGQLRAPSNVYVNGEPRAFVGGEYGTCKVPYALRIGARYSDNNYSGWFKGRIMSLRIYDIFLHDRMMANLAVDRNRFNIW